MPKKQAVPKPRTIPKKAVARCINGHRLSTPVTICQICAREWDRQKGLEEWDQETKPVGPVPAVMILRCHVGPDIVYRIPRHLLRDGKPKRTGKRRR